MEAQDAYESRQSTGREVRVERRDAAANRERVLAAARRLFAAQGANAVSMNEIARAAGVGPGTLYRRYPHKAALCAALLEDGMMQFRADIAGLVAADGLALPRLAAVLTRIVAFNEEHEPLLGAMADAVCGDRPRSASIFDGPIYHWLYDATCHLLDDAMRSGECLPLDVPWCADALLALLAIDLYRYQRQVRGFTPERILAAAHQLLARLGMAPVR